VHLATIDPSAPALEYLPSTLLTLSGIIALVAHRRSSFYRVVAVFLLTLLGLATLCILLLFCLPHYPEAAATICRSCSYLCGVWTCAVSPQEDPMAPAPLQLQHCLHLQVAPLPPPSRPPPPPARPPLLSAPLPPPAQVTALLALAGQALGIGALVAAGTRGAGRRAGGV
jgi:hypothetical protein